MASLNVSDHQPLDLHTETVVINGIPDQGLLQPVRFATNHDDQNLDGHESAEEGEEDEEVSLTSLGLMLVTDGTSEYNLERDEPTHDDDCQEHSKSSHTMLQYDGALAKFKLAHKTANEARDNVATLQSKEDALRLVVQKGEHDLRRSNELIAGLNAALPHDTEEADLTEKLLTRLKTSARKDKDKLEKLQDDLEEAEKQVRSATNKVYVAEIACEAAQDELRDLHRSTVYAVEACEKLFSWFRDRNTTKRG